MFTVCPKCALTLAVTAADLRVAQGYVRCGRCLNVFNALSRLSEERPAATPEPSANTTTATAPEPSPDTSTGAAPEPSPDTTLGGAPEPSPPTTTTAASPEQTPAPAVPSPPFSTLDDTGEIEIELDASILVTATRPPAAAGRASQPETQSLAPHPAEPVPSTSPPAPAVTVTTEAQTPPPDADAVVSAAPDAEQNNTAPQPPESPESAFELGAHRPRAALAWKLGAGVLAIALVLQIVNHYRDSLAADPALRGPLSAVYSALGVKLAPRWNVQAYDVRQLGASVAGAAAGEIVVRASVKNSASRPQPLPLLRVTLQDRFGNRIAARDVPPGDYLPSSVAPSSLLAAGSRVDATMVFVDPGPQAVGFEIDACLQQRSGEVACAHGP